jgi:DNA-binding response OmpR family regulator
MSKAKNSAETNERIIMVVEDDIKMNELTKTILETKGYIVLTAFDWENAYRIMHEVRPDLVLLDLMLPDVKVEETCWRMGKDDAVGDIPFIVMTSLNTLPAKLSAFVAGARSFLQKPFTSDELLDKVGKIFEEKEHVPVWRQMAEFQKDTDEFIKKAQRQSD